MSKRAILTRIIIPTLLIFGLIIFLVNNPRESATELILAQQRIDFGVLPEWEGPRHTVRNRTECRQKHAPYPKGSHRL